MLRFDRSNTPGWPDFVVSLNYGRICFSREIPVRGKCFFKCFQTRRYFFASHYEEPGLAFVCHKINSRGGKKSLRWVVDTSGNAITNTRETIRQLKKLAGAEVAEIKHYGITELKL